MVFRGRLVGGFPPSPVLFLLSIKAPQRTRKKKKRKIGMYMHPTTKEEDIQRK
jgi:hypothetical protein